MGKLFKQKGKGGLWERFCGETGVFAGFQDSYENELYTGDIVSLVGIRTDGEGMFLPVNPVVFVRHDYEPEGLKSLLGVSRKAFIDGIRSDSLALEDCMPACKVREVATYPWLIPTDVPSQGTLFGCRNYKEGELVWVVRKVKDNSKLIDGEIWYNVMFREDKNEDT